MSAMKVFCSSANPAMKTSALETTSLPTVCTAAAIVSINMSGMTILRDDFKT